MSALARWTAAALAIAAKDLAVERRSRDLVTSTAFFALLVVVLSSLAFYLDRPSARRLAPGVLWVAVVFSGLLATGRAWAREREGEAFLGLLLAPIPRSALFVGKLLFQWAFLLALSVALVPLVAVLFHVDFGDRLAWVLLLLALGTLGFSAPATLFGLMTVRTGARDLLLSIVVLPLCAPVLLAAVVATRELLMQAPPAALWSWVRLLLAADITLVVMSAWLFEPLATD